MLQTCPGCGVGGRRGKFCTECGTRLPVPATPGAAGGSVQGVLPRTGSSTASSGGIGAGGAPRRVVTSTGPASQSRVGAGAGSRGVVPARRTSGTGALSARPAPTARGAAIKQAMDGLAEEVFGTQDPTQSRPELLRVAQNRGGGPFYREVWSACAAGRGWTQGPDNQEGDLYDSSDRNLLCMDVAGDECVVGGADHGLKLFDLRKKRQVKTLYTKRFGHTDWVTSCVFLQDGRVVSGGQDSKLCVWAKTGVRCTDLTGHTASVSEVRASGSIAISSSYDRTLKLWDCDRGACLGTLSGHKQPVMEFLWNHSTLVSGDRGGAVRAWDAETESCIGVLSAGTDSRRGQCSALGWYGGEAGDLVMAGDQTGLLRVWDLRQGPHAVSELALHGGAALTGIASTASHIVTAGTNRELQVLSPSLEPLHTITSHKDFIYSVTTVGSKIVSGDGTGWLLVHDADTGECHYGLGANKAAVRCLSALPHRLVASGDDGSVISYDM